MERQAGPRLPAACGVQGCLFGAVALFVVLLIALLVIAFFRFSEPPTPRVQGGTETGYQLSAISHQSEASEPVAGTPRDGRGRRQENRGALRMDLGSAAA